MPYVTEKFHHRRRERVVWRKGQGGGEYPAGVGCAFGPGDQRFPHQQVGFGDGTGGYAVGWRGGEEFVLLEEAFVGEGGCHFGGEGGAEGEGREVEEEEEK